MGVKENTKKKIDMWAMVLIPAIAVIVSLIIKANFLIFILLYFVIPCIYLSFRNRYAIKRTLLFSVISAIPLGIIWGCISHINKEWYTFSIFPRIFGLVPLEDLLWNFLLCYLIVIFYEHFVDKSNEKLVSSNFKYLFITFTLFSIIFLYFLFFKQNILVFNYSYFYLGLITFLLPVISFLWFFPRKLSAFIKVGAYFFFYTLIMEITSLKLGHWVFPGKYLGWLQVGWFGVPLEEIIYFFMMVAITVLSYYEFFVDDRK
jgi:hypothetical protein